MGRAATARPTALVDLVDDINGGSELGHRVGGERYAVDAGDRRADAPGLIVRRMDLDSAAGVDLNYPAAEEHNPG
jgi:hypothetical protein